MRISDWSSDVCSSDLLAFPLIGKSNEKAFAKKLDVSIAGRYERGSGLGDFDTFNPKVGIDFKPTDGLTLRGSWGTAFHAPPMRYEIGRASCRARVGQYV